MLLQILYNQEKYHKTIFFSSVAPKNKKFDKKLQSQAFDTIFGLIQEGAIFVPPPHWLTQ